MQNKFFYGYRIIETIHTDNRFVVCKAYNREENLVVLKIARTEFLTSNPQAIEKAFREAEAMKAISRKYNSLRLVRVFDVIRTERLFYIVMEYVEGVSLEKSLSTMSLPRNQVDLDDIENQLTDIVRTVSGFGYTPATLEPSNVMITPRDTVVLLNYLDLSAPQDFIGVNVVDDFMDRCYRDIPHYDDSPRYDNYSSGTHDSSYNTPYQSKYYDERPSRSKSVIIGLSIIAAVAFFVIIFLLIQSSSSNRTVRVANVENNLSKELVLFKKGELYGFKDINGKIVVSAKYDYAEKFREGRALVKRYGEYGDKIECGYIDYSGKEVIPLKFTKASSFLNGKAEVEKSYLNKGYIINRNGDILEEFTLRTRYRY